MVTTFENGSVKMRLKALRFAPAGNKLSSVGRATPRGSIAIETIHITGNMTTTTTANKNTWRMICRMTIPRIRGDSQRVFVPVCAGAVAFERESVR